MNKKQKIKLMFLLPALLASAVSYPACTTAHSRTTTVAYQPLPEGIPVRLGRLELSPPYILEGLSPQLPEVIYSCLKNSGFSVTRIEKDAAILDVFIHSKTWSNNYTPCESVTISLKLSLNETPAVYHLCTEDCEQGIDSFSGTLKLIEENIALLAQELGYAN